MNNIKTIFSLGLKVGLDEYIRTQKADMIRDNLSKKEYVDPFKVEKP